MFVLLINLLLLLIYEVDTNIRVLDSGVFNFDKDAVALQFYVDLENENRTHECDVSSWCKRCCLAAPGEAGGEASEAEGEACDAVDAAATSYDVIAPRARRSLAFAYPTAQPYDQRGFCDFMVDFTCDRYKRSRKRFALKVPFDTKLTRADHPELSVAACESADQDALRECAPADCDLKYNGLKPFYDEESRRCRRAPECVGEGAGDLPGAVYVPRSNACRRAERPLSFDDVYAMSRPAARYCECCHQPQCICKNARVRVLSDDVNEFLRKLQWLADFLLGRIKCKDKGACCGMYLLSAVSAAAAVCIGMVCCLCVVHTLIGVRRELRMSEQKVGKYRKVVRAMTSDVRCTAPCSRDELVVACSRETDRLVGGRGGRGGLVRDVMRRQLPEVRSSLLAACEAARRPGGGLSDSSLEDLHPGHLDTSSTTSLDDDERRHLMK
ncbi:hypothetical protein JYU34_013157 [Plutella xylostella]|uniref:Uncharacterized protein n=1 Tax=Plutella xylostella TaxID=51655 RepID=A0ABQ7QD28_PLUXY|nr:hypothetical protein JYU34_013157 [Plutella xylostella]